MIHFSTWNARFSFVQRLSHSVATHSMLQPDTTYQWGQAFVILEEVRHKRDSGLVRLLPVIVQAARQRQSYKVTHHFQRGGA
jgi:poly-gamma-glutamate capsule biosynthesis protein CapA/YwtB (metallophosphatase superfamily)